MMYYLTVLAVTIIVIVAAPFYFAVTLLLKIGMLIAVPAGALTNFGMKLIEEQRQRENTAKRG